MRKKFTGNEQILFLLNLFNNLVTGSVMRNPKGIQIFNSTIAGEIILLTISLADSLYQIGEDRENINLKESIQKIKVKDESYDIPNDILTSQSPLDNSRGPV